MISKGQLFDIYSSARMERNRSTTTYSTPSCTTFRYKEWRERPFFYFSVGGSTGARIQRFCSWKMGHYRARIRRNAPSLHGSVGHGPAARAHSRQTQQPGRHQHGRVQIFLLLFEQFGRFRHSCSLLRACKSTHRPWWESFFEIETGLSIFLEEFHRAVKISTGEDLSENLVNVVYAIFDKDGDRKVCLFF